MNGCMYPELSDPSRSGNPIEIDPLPPVTAKTSRYELRRVQWSSKVEFLLAVIGFAVDLGNVWRFPYICYRNGGGAFMIPYLVMFFLGGLPLFYLELALGQHRRSGCISIWRSVCPLFKGIGFAICFVATYMAIYYNTIIAWSVYFMFSSFRSQVPWATCGNPWNTPSCTEIGNLTNTSWVSTNATNFTATSAAEEYFRNHVLEVNKSEGFAKMGPIKWELALCLLGVFFVVYFALWKGPRSSGKRYNTQEADNNQLSALAVWITATLPYIVLVILLLRGITLPGAGIGIKYYLTPNWTRIQDTSVWTDAATQIFFSLGPGFGVLLALASYNDFHNNCYNDAIVTSVVNCFTSFLSGFVIFSTLGYMSHILKKPISDVAGDGGPGLIFIVYPQAIATMKGSSFWSICFFFMLITLGIDSTFGGLESLITAFCDEFPNSVGRRRELFVLGLVVYCYIGSLATTTHGGNYLVQFLDHYGVSFSILGIVVVEAIAVCWCYGIKRFSNDVEAMLGFKPGIGWRICWVGVSPVFLMLIFAVSCKNMKPMVYEGYHYPAWSQFVGWILILSSLSCIPVFMVYKLLSLKGTFLERLKLSITPEVNHPPAETLALSHSPSQQLHELHGVESLTDDLQPHIQIAKPFSHL